MSKIVWDIREMSELATSVRRQAEHLVGVHEALSRDLGQLPEAEAALSRYQLRVVGAEDAERYRQPSASVAGSMHWCPCSTTSSARRRRGTARSWATCPPRSPSRWSRHAVDS